MPWRLIQFIVLFALLLLFIAFNLENKCAINFGFTAITDVPVYLTVFFAFMAGMLCALPFVLGFKRKKKEKIAHGKGLLAKITKNQSKNPGEKAEDSTLADKNHYGID